MYSHSSPLIRCTDVSHSVPWASMERPVLQCSHLHLSPASSPQSSLSRSVVSDVTPSVALPGSSPQSVVVLCSQLSPAWRQTTAPITWPWVCLWQDFLLLSPSPSTSTPSARRNWMVSVPPKSVTVSTRLHSLLTCLLTKSSR
jgi:hypothetical protein